MASTGNVRCWITGSPRSPRTVISSLRTQVMVRDGTFDLTKEIFLVVYTKCGLRYMFEEPEEVPLHDQECQCGDEYVIKWKD